MNVPMNKQMNERMMDRRTTNKQDIVISVKSLVTNTFDFEKQMRNVYQLFVSMAESFLSKI